MNKKNNISRIVCNMVNTVKKRRSWSTENKARKYKRKIPRGFKLSYDEVEVMIMKFEASKETNSEFLARLKS